MFYEFSQNNSGGYFIVDDQVCSKLFIEADSEEDAILKAENLGCYWNGVAKGLDCPCCGDRWYPYADKVDLMKFAADGYSVSVYDGVYGDTIAEWNRRYGKYKIVEKPKFKTERVHKRYEGLICFDNVEEYAQYLADEYGGWTTPEARVFYKDGRVVEIHTAKKA